MSNEQAVATRGRQALSERELGKQIVDKVEKRISEWVEEGDLELPENYAVGNALKAAWLKILAAEDKHGDAALEVCSRESIANALLDMVVQGLAPQRDQCYFVVYGKELVLMRSYHGSQAVVKQIWPGTEIYAQPVYKGDSVRYKIERGRTVDLEHEQDWDNVRNDLDAIEAAYCVIERPDRDPYIEIMKVDAIEQAWMQGQVYNPEAVEGEESMHQKFPDRAVRKTVINRACSTLLRTADDSHVLRSVRRQDALAAEAAADLEAAEMGNRDVIDIDAKRPGIEGETAPEGGESEPETAEAEEGDTSPFTEGYGQREGEESEAAPEEGEAAPPEDDDGETQEAGSRADEDEEGEPDGASSDESERQPDEPVSASSSPEEESDGDEEEQGSLLDEHASPAQAFLALCDEEDLDPSRARKVLVGLDWEKAGMDPIDDARKLTNDHYAVAVEHAANFIAKYREEYGE